MFKESVQVVQVIDDRIRIRFSKKEMCGCCRYSSVCGLGAEGAKGKEEEVEVINTGGLDLSAGDRVEIAVEEKKSLLANLILFIFPVLVFVAALIVSRARGPLMSFFLALFFVSVYYVTMRAVLRGKQEYFSLKILRKL